MLQPLQYWFPGKKTPGDLKYRFTGKFNSSKDSYGPIDKKRGLMIGAYRNASPIFRPDHQTWHKRKNYWIGISNENWNTDHIARAESFYPGAFVKLADGRFYNIPVANPFLDSCSFNLKDVMDIDGTWMREVEPRFKAMSDKAVSLIGNIIHSLLKSDRNIDHGLTADELRDFVIEIIQINYDLTGEEISLLGISDPAQYWDVLSVFCDSKAIEKTVIHHIEQAGDGNSTSINFLTTMAGGSGTLAGGMAMTKDMCQV